MARWMIVVVAVFAAIYAATVLISGSPEYLVPGAVIVLLIVGYAVIERLLTKRHMARHDGDAAAAMADSDDWAIPSAHLIPDDARPTGDTPEAHDELDPHDLPPDHPGRSALEQRAARATRTD